MTMPMYLEEQQLIEKKLNYLRNQIYKAEQQGKYGAAKDINIAILDYYDLLVKIDIANNTNKPLEINTSEAEIIFDQDLEKNLVESIRERYYEMTYPTIIALDKL